jgi:predicted DNA-binding transcriptional regulator YafY
MASLPPQDDVAAFVDRGVDAALFRYRARVIVHAPASDIVQWLPDAVVVEAVDDHTCRVHAGADTPHLLAAHIAMLDADFEVTEPPELIHALRRLADRCVNAARPAAR